MEPETIMTSGQEMALVTPRWWRLFWKGCRRVARRLPQDGFEHAPPLVRTNGSGGGCKRVRWQPAIYAMWQNLWCRIKSGGGRGHLEMAALASQRWVIPSVWSPPPKRKCKNTASPETYVPLKCSYLPIVLTWGPSMSNVCWSEGSNPIQAPQIKYSMTGGHATHLGCFAAIFGAVETTIASQVKRLLNYF